MPVAAVAAGVFDVDASAHALEPIFAAANSIAKSATYELQSCAQLLKTLNLSMHYCFTIGVG
jgi:hypothetical protein